jgi:hypothetical protein
MGGLRPPIQPLDVGTRGCNAPVVIEARNAQEETVDPDATLASLRDLYRSVLADEDSEDPRTVELAERVDALDRWISCGGFLPSAWGKVTP